MANRRLFYAVEAVGIAPLGSATHTAVKGCQSVGITTTFNLEQVFELGQIAIYENIENIPDVEVTLEKTLDGSPPIYTLATQGSPTATLAGRANGKCHVALSLFSDMQDSASGTPITQCGMSGMAVSSLSYTFPVDGNFTENVTLVGNDKVWLFNGFTFTGGFTNTDTPIGLGGVNRREDLLFEPTVDDLDANGQVADPNATILPRDIPGISPSGTNNRDSNGRYLAKVQNITVSTDLGREELFELGNKAPYDRYINFPVEVTTEIEIIALSGDLVSATEEGVAGGGNNTLDQSIRIATREGLRLNLGTKNRMQSSNIGGGDAGGGNATCTFSYRNFSNLTVQHSGDPSVSLRNSPYIV